MPPRGPRRVLCVVLVTSAGVRHRARVQPRRDEPGDVRHVHDQRRPDLVGDGAEAGEVDLPRVGARAGDDDRAAGARARVAPPRRSRSGRPPAARRTAPASRACPRPRPVWPCVRWPPCARLMPSSVVPGSSHGEVGGEVRRRPGVRLDVGVVGAEELLHAVAGQVLGHVHPLAAAVVALARQALGVLVREHGAGRLEHGVADEVLGRDQLERTGSGRCRSLRDRVEAAAGPGSAEGTRAGLRQGRVCRCS